MFVLSVEDITSLKLLNPINLLDGMPISVIINGIKELYIWWENDSSIDDNFFTIKLDSPNENAGRFKKVFNKYILSASVPITDPTPSEVGIFWLDTSFMALYLAGRFTRFGITTYKWMQLIENAGGK